MITIHQFAESLGNTIDAKDPYTGKHSFEVAEISRILAETIGLDKKMTTIVHIAGHLHDIGKIGVPDCILSKPGQLDPIEKEAIKQHPQIGASILEPVQELATTGICEMVLHHHERFDGKGYPYGLSGESIPLGARIISVADSLSAMVGRRPYRPSKSFDAAVDEIVTFSGTQFDPVIARALLTQKETVHQLLFSSLNEKEQIKQDFHLDIKQNNGDLYIHSQEDFDGSCADDLVHLTELRSNGNEQVGIHAHGMGEIVSSGCSVLRCCLHQKKRPFI